MRKSYIGEYNPDYATPPGWVLEERLEIRDWSQADFARRCGRSPKLINEIISGKAPIEPDTALQFEKVLDLKASVWLNLESSYQLFLAREKERKQLEESIGWFDKFLIKELRKADILPKTNDPLEGVKSLLVFFGVSSPAAWEAKLGSAAAHARHTPKLESNKETVSVWLRLGELEASQQDCAPYDEAKFREALTKIRRLSRHKVDVFYPRTLELCNEAGVALAFIRPFPSIKLSGAAWWLNRKTPVIQLTLRGKWNDVFWFTFFHEAAHILLHNKKETFIDADKKDGAEWEEEADEWARNFLIPPGDWKGFLDRGIYSTDFIQQFALEQEITPAIVLGRLQYENRLRWDSRMNSSLKERYAIT